MASHVMSRMGMVRAVQTSKFHVVSLSAGYALMWLRDQFGNGSSGSPGALSSGAEILAPYAGHNPDGVGRESEVDFLLPSLGMRGKNVLCS